MDVALILFIGGVGLLTFLSLWLKQNPLTDTGANPSLTAQNTPTPSGQDPAGGTRQWTGEVPGGVESGDAVLVARGQGQLIFANAPARQWLGVNGGEPHLEQVLRLAKPADHFLELLAHEGQSSFQLGKRWVAASSHRIPTGTETRTVVVLRELASDTHTPEQLDLSLAMHIINQVGSMVLVSNGVEPALQSLLTILKNELQFDAGEINLYDANSDVLTPRGWAGDMMYLLALTEYGGNYRVGEGVTGWIAQNNAPILLANRDELTTFQPKVPTISYNSIVGVPLNVGAEMIGTLELASYHDNFFNPSHVALLQAISQSVALAIYNASLYGEQVERLKSITTLQQMVELESRDEIESAPAEGINVEETVYAVLNRRVAELVDAEMCGVFVYDEARRALLPAPPFYGLPTALVRSLIIPISPNSPQANLWENQAYWISNDLSDEPMAQALGFTDAVVNVAGIRNTAWLPLLIGDSRIGILAVTNKRRGDFITPDISNLQAIAAQVAIVVENLRFAARERRLDAALAGLQEMTYAVGALTQEHELFTEITERIAKLMNVEMCGILLYNQDTSLLTSRLPFYGVPDHLVESYRVAVEPGSVIEELWQDEPFWFSNRIDTDPLVFAAKLDTLAREIGIQKTLMAKLSTGGRDLGVVQVSNRTDGGDFDNAAARLLSVYAAQAATMIENARLFGEVQRTSEQAQRMRRIAEIAGAIVESQTGLPPLLREIAGYLDSPVVYINMLDEVGNLVAYPHWVIGSELDEAIYQDMSTPQAKYTVALSRKPFYSNDMRSDERILNLYRKTAERFHLRSVAVVPLIIGERSLGELGVANRDGVYSSADIDVLVTIATQIASTLERLLQYELTGQNLSRRMQELDAVARVSNELTQTVDFTAIMNTIRKEALNATSASGSTVAILRPKTDWVVPVVPEMENRLGNLINMPKLADIETASILRGSETIIVNNYDMSDYEPLPREAKSALTVGIVYADEIVGVIHVYHVEPNRFDDRAANFLQTLASKAALGYANALRYRQQEENNRRLQLRVEQLNRIFDLGHLSPSTTDPVEMLEMVAYSIQQSVGFDSVLMLLLDESAGVLERVTHAGMPIEEFRKTRDRVMAIKTLDALLTRDYLMSESYFFPVEKLESWYHPEVDALSLLFEGNRTINLRGKNNWRDGDMLLVPLKGSSGRLMGLMSLDRPFNDHRPDNTTVETLEIFANQAATALENSRLYMSSVRNAQQEALFTDMLGAMSGSLEIGNIAMAMAHGVHSLYPYDRLDIMVVNTKRNGFDAFRVGLDEYGSLDIQQERITDLGRGAMEYAYHEQLDAFYSGEDGYSQFSDLRAYYEQGERQAYIMALNAGGVAYGVVHIGRNSASDNSFANAHRIYKRAAQLFAGAVQNARLFDQAIELQLLNESVVESIQQGIIVLDRSGRILTVNSFMERYGWNEDATNQDVFAYEPETARLIADDLRDVLDNGIPRSRLNQTTMQDDGMPLVRSFYLYPLVSDETVRGAVILIEDVTQRARLEQDLAARAEQLDRLTRVSGMITSSLERSDVIDLAISELQALIPYHTATLWRRNGSYMVLEGGTGDDAPALPDPMAAFIGGANAHNAPEEVRIRINDYELLRQMVDGQRAVVLPATPPAQDILPIPGTQSAVESLSVPLVNQGHVVGMIVLSSQQYNVYTGTADQNIALTFASQVAIALANADLFQQTFDRTSELGLLLEVAQTTTLKRDMNEIFNIIVEMMFNALDMDRCTITIWDEVDDALEVRIDRNRHDASRELAKGTRLDLSGYPARRQALRERDVIVAFRADPDQNYAEEVAELTRDQVGARMLVPLVASDSSIGLIVLEQNVIDSYQGVSQQKIRLAKALGAQVAIAIENGRLTEEMSSHVAESIMINELTQALSSTFNIEDMINIVRRQLPAVTGAEEMYLALYDEETNLITFPFALSKGQDVEVPPRELGEDEVSFVIKRKRPLTIGADYFSPEELRRSLGIVSAEADYKSYMGIPLSVEDKVFGVIALRDTRRTKAFTVNEQNLLSTVGAQLGAAVQNARLFERIQSFADQMENLVDERTLELEEERDRIDTLYQITSELSRSLDMERVQQRALGMVAKAVNAEDGAIMSIDPLTDQLITQAALVPTSIMIMPDNRYSHPSEMVGKWLIDNGETDVLIDDLHQFEGWDTTATGAQEWRSAVGVVLENTENDPQGVMVLLSHKPNAFGESEQRLLVAAGNQVAAATNNADLYSLIRDQADRLGALLRTEKEEAEKSAAILASITDGVVLSDADGSIVLFNSAAERILQLPREQVLGQPLSRFTGLYDADINAWAQRIQSHTERPGDVFDVYIDDRLKLGDKVVSVQISPVYTGVQFLGMVSVFRDITREVEVDRLKGEFVANVSHELRTPLTPIKGFTELLLMGAGGPVTDMQKSTLGMIKDNVERLTTLVEDILDISKIDAGRDTLHIQMVNVESVLNNVLEALQSRQNHKKRELNVSLEIAPDIPEIEADAGKLSRITSNIIDNAFNYTPNGGSITIKAKHLPDDQRVLISVTDTGVGIAEEFRDDIWKRFHRYEEHALKLDVAGTGLGLSIVKEMVEMHHGEVWFETEIDKGTTFFISLPTEQAQSARGTQTVRPVIED